MSDARQDLPVGPPSTLLPDDHAAAREALGSGRDPYEVAATDPASCLVWAVLAEDYLRENGSRGAVTAYAYARTGYHRGLDALRRAGWRGAGTIPVSHTPNQGFLRALLVLAESAAFLGEMDEAERCDRFLRDAGTGPEEVRNLR